ncbi:hypothetical protein BDN72DRAFT_966221 [Pluteus cervinus]|uniref:Uncharacterized protein n=1 Tax=Pluteus cervinus TaxID=181527 RepID=A0ACD2ZZM4_9AGAR|nr:hypothetical protein BDN72DRAFT_966221 [Pluteus cervinus]
MDSERVLVAVSRDKIDAEIAILKERIRALRTERNRLAPISRLPPNVLTEIFTWLQQLCFGQFYTLRAERLQKDALKWIIVTHISQHWRQIAFSSSSKSLWDVIAFTSTFRESRYATESFNRLGSKLPFYLIHDSWFKDPMLWAAIARECHRVRFLRDGVGSSVLVDFNQPMPLLEDVEIQCQFNRTCIISPFIISPSLRTLVLSRCDFTWYWPALPHLTTLEISEPIQKVSFDCFLVILFGSPRLEHLIIRHIFPTSLGSQPRDLSPVEPSPLLPRLSSLHAESHFSANLLPHLRFTDNFSIHLTDEGHITAGSVPLIMNTLKCILLESSKAIRHVHLRAQGLEYGCSLGLLHAEKWFIYLRLNPWHQGRQDFGSLAKSLSILPLDRMEELDTNVFDNPVLWKESNLGQLPSLRQLRLNGGAFLEYIAEDYEAYKKAHGQRSLSFTSVHDVDIRGTHFTLDLKNSVCDALAGRDRLGYRFKHFVVQFATREMAKASVKEFRKYVDHVSASVAMDRRTRMLEFHNSLSGEHR